MLKYVQFDRLSDAESSLDELCSCLERVSKSEHAWKYAIISTHCALQGYLCIALRNGNSFQTWKKNQYKKWQEADDNELKLPDPQLDFFMELFDKVFSSSTNIDRNLIVWLNETRNGLVHFNTDSYLIEKALIIKAVAQAVQAIKQTPSLAKGIFFYEDVQESSFQKACKKVETRLNSLTSNT
ncbi:hypothetical protein [Desulfotalea psychrophila]|uniref:HEPN AbiU2-like domain-containing protein n=1 Tax=Desulfotalea psychrophila (strain LSv54 / DSM 12343) TaxID=177439 RepID=Q6ANP7_DESPS|nr:hypothetical protein [Desulfotalea psychrophila]CAG36027.1 unknown protein [Desulfotalea psychrophila LSv54]